jgi:Phospholipase_D-nuclease N-terminal
MLLAVLIVIPLLLIWVLTLVDLFRRHDLSTGGTVLWALVVLVLPVIGVIIYFVARPPQPTDRGPTLDGVGDESFEPIRRRHGPA